MTKISILVVRTKLAFNSVYNGLKSTFSPVIYLLQIQKGFVNIIDGE